MVMQRKSSPSSTPTSREPMYTREQVVQYANQMREREQPRHGHLSHIHVILIVLVMVSVVTSIVSLILVSNVTVTANAIKEQITPQSISLEDFLAKMTAHEELSQLSGANPVNIVQVSQNNLGSLQSQIAGLDVSYVGSYLVQYPTGIVIYDYVQDIVKGVITIPEANVAASQVLAQMYANHEEVRPLSTEQPTGGQLDGQTLSTLKSQFPDVYQNAKPGDYLWRYERNLIIYDAVSDQIVNIVGITQ